MAKPKKPEKMDANYSFGGPFKSHEFFDIDKEVI